MKARVKATGEIVEVVYNGFYYESIKDERIFDKPELEIMPKTKAPDYWTRLEHQAAIAAMQGFCANTKFMRDHEGDFQCNEDMIAVYAKDIAHALVEKYKKEEK